MTDYITIPLSKTGKYKGQYEAIVSIEDADLAELNWVVQPPNKNNKSIYVRRTDRTRKQKTIRLHRVIMKRIVGRELDKSEQIDHINNNPLDNRRSNLRLATNAQNGHNRNEYSNNRSGYKGACWHKASKKWIAQITVSGITIHLGSFSDKLEAHKFYCKAALEYFGEFANFGENSPFNKKDFED